MYCGETHIAKHSKRTRTTLSLILHLLSVGGGLWDVPVIGHELLWNQSWQWKMTRVCPCVWPMFSFVDRFSNTIFDYLHIPFSKRWTTKPYVCATMLNLCLFQVVNHNYQLSLIYICVHKYSPQICGNHSLTIHDWGCVHQENFYTLW